MQRFLILTILGGIVALSANGADLAMTTAQSDEEGRRVLAVEDQWVAAEVSRDEATLRRVLDDRFVHNSSDGTTTGKEDMIRAILEMRMTGSTTSERTTLVDGDTAVVFGTAELRFASETGEDSVSRLRYTSIYINRGGEWRALALQMAEHAHD
jgi:ketosteroid isomerase-like protein